MRCTRVLDPTLHGGVNDHLLSLLLLGRIGRDGVLVAHNTLVRVLASAVLRVRGILLLLQQLCQGWCQQVLHEHEGLAALHLTQHRIIELRVAQPEGRDEEHGEPRLVVMVLVLVRHKLLCLVNHHVVAPLPPPRAIGGADVVLGLWRTPHCGRVVVPRFWEVGAPFGGSHLRDEGLLRAVDGPLREVTPVGWVFRKPCHCLLPQAHRLEPLALLLRLRLLHHQPLLPLQHRDLLDSGDGLDVLLIALQRTARDGGPDHRSSTTNPQSSRSAKVHDVPRFPTSMSGCSHPTRETHCPPPTCGSTLRTASIQPVRETGGGLVHVVNKERRAVVAERDEKRGAPERRRQERRGANMAHANAPINKDTNKKKGTDEDSDVDVRKWGAAAAGSALPLRSCS
eukprot:Sspe_Gene.5512::Locus_1821_Transcript_1_1_Confidence_1.000_Length_1859::g.5512::m.5512